MININEVRQMMPSSRKGTILSEVEELIKEAASKDKEWVELPQGFFGPGVENDVMRNAKNPPPIFNYVKEELEKGGFSIGRNIKNLTFAISWK